MSKTVWDELKEERKLLQSTGRLPMWVSTPSWQILKDKYVTEKEPDLYSIYKRIAGSAASHMIGNEEHWEKAFFNILWQGWLAASTPVLSNMGTGKGCPVSCSGSNIGDNIDSFYSTQRETALLTQQGFGTSAYLGFIRERGRPISGGGKASGIIPVLKDFIQLSRDVSQGNTRRGAWAGYLEIDHGDYWEAVRLLEKAPDDCNVGWVITNDFIERLDRQEPDATSRYQKAMKVKMITGKGYFFFVDKVNEASPPMYKDRKLEVRASNLCTEITLFADDFHTFTCVLSSMNLAKWDEWKDTDAVQVATVFLDCVASEFIKIGRAIPGLEKAVRFTESSRALGLGALGFHTYLQDNMIAFDSLEAGFVNKTMFSHLKREAVKASKQMAIDLGEPEWCKGYGMRNTHLLAVAPNTSSALVCGGVSQGIEPIYKNVYTQGSSAGEIPRINPSLLNLMKKKGIYNKTTIDRLIADDGSVQDNNLFTDEEKLVYRTAFEVSQYTIIRHAATRQPDICQAQSINLFFGADEDEAVISGVHKEAFKNKNIKSLYYIRSEAGVKGSTGECLACEG